MKHFDNNGVANLYAAIFGQAVDDDVKSIKAELKKELGNIGYTKEQANILIDEYSQFIVSNVREAILLESQSYPNYNKRENTRTNKRIVNAVLKNIK